MKKSAFWRWAAVLCLASASLGALATEECTVSQLEMPVTMIGNRPVVKIGINGTQVPMLLDSGAFFSIIKPAAASLLKLKLEYLPYNYRIEGVAGEMEARLTVVDRLQIGDNEVPKVDFIVGGNEDSAGTMGIIGRNVLSMADTEYDLANGMVRFFFPKGDCSETSFAYWAGDKPYVVLPLLRPDGDSRLTGLPPIRAVAQLNDEKIKVLFDTGAGMSVLTAGAARRAGVKPDQMQRAGKAIGVGKGSLDIWTAPFQRFALGGESISNIRLTVAEDMNPSEAEMLVGIDFFLAHRIYVSKRQRRMYFTHNGGPVFALSALDHNQTAAVAPPAPAAASSAPTQPEVDESGKPMDAAAYARRSAGYASRLNYAAALADLDQACNLDPTQAEYFARRGIVRQALRQPMEALRDFNQAVKLDPTHTEALLRRADMRGAANPAAVLADLQTLDRSLPPQAQERLQMARLYERLGQPREAITQLSHWLATRETDVRLPDVLISRCMLRARLGTDLDQALDDCDRAVSADGKNADYREDRGLLRLKRGELDRAQADFDKALDLRPASPWALYGRGIVRSQRGQTEAGRADLEAARKLRPQIDAQLAKFGLPAPG